MWRRTHLCLWEEEPPPRGSLVNSQEGPLRNDSSFLGYLGLCSRILPMAHHKQEEAEGLGLDSEGSSSGSYLPSHLVLRTTQDIKIDGFQISLESESHMEILRNALPRKSFQTCFWIRLLLGQALGDFIFQKAPRFWWAQRPTGLSWYPNLSDTSAKSRSRNSDTSLLAPVAHSIQPRRG